MEPVSHLLLGGAIAATRRRDTRAPGTVAALVLGSIFPDVDLVLVPWGFDFYLRTHAGWTHSLMWSFAEALLFAGLLRPLVRSSRFWTLAIAGWVGIIGHILSDCADGSDIALFSPFAQTLYGAHLFPMGEPFVLILLSLACLVAWRRPRRGRLAAMWAFSIIAIILLAKEASQRGAAARYTASVPEPQERVEIVPVRNRLFEWDIYDQLRDEVRVWRIDARSGESALLFERHNAVDALVPASRDLPVVRDLLSRTRIPLVRVDAEGGDTVILWSDARMCTATRCDVSFGGIASADGVMRAQIIQVGGFRQVRPLPPG